MKKIEFGDIVEKTAALIDRCLKNIETEALCRIKALEEKEEIFAAKWALSQIAANASLAAETDSYACQDTGLAVFFVDYGSEIYIDGGCLDDALNGAVKKAYADARKSVAGPLDRLNTGDNTPAVIHTSVTKGNAIKITFLAKGAGSENMSRLYMLTPSKGINGIIDSVVDCVKTAGANPCPPIIVGVGIGGDFEKCAILAKKALTRPTGEPSPFPEAAKIEHECLNRLNALKIGAAGLGGIATALSVAVETYPTHIGMLPVAVNIQCHSVRHGTIIF